MLRFLSLAAALGLGCTQHQPALESGELADLYGNDDRHEAYEFPVGSPQRRAAEATAALMVFPGGISPGRDLRVVRGPDIGKERSWCDGVRFYEQPSMSSCTGFLVGPDLIATAGHCVDSQSCKDVAVVFDYAYRGASDSRLDGGTLVFAGDDVYTCKSVIAHGYIPDSTCSTDYALIRLDRSVYGRAPLRVATEMPERGESLFAVGHPSGLPAKVATNALVRAQSARSFGYELDLFAGNSGSPVFDEEGIVRGIHVCGGEDDYTADPAPWNPDYDLADGTCQVPIHCDQYCGRLGTAQHIGVLSASIGAP